MNAEQREYIGIINQSAEEVILIKKTGWEEVNLPGHVHGKCQIIYTLAYSGGYPFSISGDIRSLPS